MNKITLSPTEVVNRIHSIRGLRVILDHDLAEFYEVSTGRLNEQIKRNSHRFPNDFVFQLTQREFETVQTSSNTTGSKYGGRRKLPHGFTEHGTLMAAFTLKSEKATQTSTILIRAFTQLRSRDIATENETTLRLERIENFCKDLAGSFAQLQGQHRQKSFSPFPNLSTAALDLNSRVDPILRAVAQYYDLTLADLKSKTRIKKIASPRQVAIYLIRSRLSLTVDEIGSLFDKDHSTVLYAHRRVESLIKSNQRIAAAIQSIQQSLATTP